MLNCTVCENKKLKTIIDFGDQPPANRFIDESSLECRHDIHPLAFGYCQHCGVMQLTKRMPFDAIRPRHSWLLYNEPEGHLDGIVEELIKLPGITQSSRILGITYKDQSTVDRLAKLGFSQGSCINDLDFEAGHALFGLETIQQILCNPSKIELIKNKYNKADLLLMRHVVEHSDTPKRLLLTLKGLINKNGYLIMELPDSEKILKAGNHAFVWEEHISYFTEESLEVLAKEVGARITWFKRCSYPYEDSLLVAFCFENEPAARSENPIDLSVVDGACQQFKSLFDANVTQWKKLLQEHTEQRRKIAVFGAGHLAAKFINFLQLKSLIECVIDDNPNKAGMQMPGSLLPIVPSSELLNRNIGVCISTLSPESEAKVRPKLASFFEKGGIFIPAFSVVD